MPSRIVLAVAASSPAARADAPQVRTFERAIELALARNPEIASAREAIASAEATAAGTRAHRWVTLDVAYAGNYWRQPYSIMFGSAAFVLHEQTTSATIVTLAQPLTGLAYLTELVDAAEHQTAATRRDYDRVRLDVAYRTADACLRLLAPPATAHAPRHTEAAS